MANAWLEHVKQYRKKHPKKSYSQCLKDAAKTYKKKAKTGKAKKKA